MDRRQFLRGISTAAGTHASIQAAAKDSQETRLVKLQVNGFYCVTCAVGLETMLRGLDGVTRAKAEWPSGRVAIGFDERLIGEKKLRAFILECGFSVANHTETNSSRTGAGKADGSTDKPKID
jgi:copper chaperone CopZ